MDLHREAGKRPLDAAVSGTARSLLLTLLGEFVLPSGAEVWTSAVLKAMALLGVEDKTTRQVLGRMSSSGLLEAERVGRRARWKLTPHSLRVLAEGANRIYRFGEGRQAWDGRWLILLVATSDNSRTLRYRLRSRLSWIGLAPVAPGVWISPWADREEEAKLVMSELTLEGSSSSFVGAPGGIGDPFILISRGWNLTHVENEYHRFMSVMAALGPRSDAESFLALSGLVNHWRRFPAIDPGLPVELLPEHWPGRPAAALFHDRYRAWKPRADAWWMATLNG